MLVVVVVIAVSLTAIGAVANALVDSAATADGVGVAAGGAAADSTTLSSIGSTLAGDFSTGASIVSGGSSAFGGVTLVDGTVASLTPVGGAVAAAAGGAVGNLVGQGLSIAIGNQKSFSFDELATAAISSAVSEGLATPSPAGTSTGFSVSLAARAAATAAEGDALTQGIGVIIGTQHAFNWTEVAAAAAGAGVANAVGQVLPPSAYQGALGNSLTAAKIAAGTVQGVAGGLVTAELKGGSVQVTQIAADAFGNALGENLVPSTNITGVSEVPAVSSTELALQAHEDANNAAVASAIDEYTNRLNNSLDESILGGDGYDDLDDDFDDGDDIEVGQPPSPPKPSLPYGFDVDLYPYIPFDQPNYSQGLIIREIPAGATTPVGNTDPSQDPNYQIRLQQFEAALAGEYGAPFLPSDIPPTIASNLSISAPVAVPVATAIGDSVTGMQQFKAGALNQYDVYGAINEHQGNDGLVVLNGLGYAATQTLLPGNPVDAALMFGSGPLAREAAVAVPEVIGLVSPKIEAVLTRDVSSFFGQGPSPLVPPDPNAVVLNTPPPEAPPVSTQVPHGTYIPDTSPVLPEGPILFTDNTTPIELKLDESLGDQLNVEAGTRTGTLERGDINSNIVDGVPPDYAGHHLIGIAEAQNFPVMQQAANLGFDINEGSNGIALPTDPDLSVETDLPLHTPGDTWENILTT